MASLLPHKTLAYKGTATCWWTASRVVRRASGTSILQAVGGMACKADDLMAKKKDEGREFVKDKRVVYIYHNTVDAVGDDGQDRGQDLRGGAAGDRRTGGAGRLHHQQPERPPHRRHGGPRLPVHRDGPRRDGQEQARREAGRHGPGQEALPDRPQPARPRGGLARQD